MSILKKMAKARSPEPAVRSKHLRPVGVIRSTLKSRRDAPKQGNEGGPDAWIELLPSVESALKGIVVGSEVIILTWFHKSKRDVLQVHPRSDRRRALTGVFATRSPDRPNPIGLHPVIVRKVEKHRILVGPIEAVDGTPVVDIKPLLACDSGSTSAHS